MEELWLSKILDKKIFFPIENKTWKFENRHKKIETDAEKKETDELMN